MTCNTNTKENELLISFSINGDLDEVNLLLNYKDINVNAQDNDGDNALMWASEEGQLDIVNRLNDFQQMQIKKGFELAYSNGSMFVPIDLIDLIVKFTT